MAVTKKSAVGKTQSKKPAKSSPKVTKPTSAEKLATATILGRF